MSEHVVIINPAFSLLTEQDCLLCGRSNIIIIIIYNILYIIIVHTALPCSPQSLPTSQYPALLQQSLETDVFSDIITILLEDYVRCGRVCLSELQALTRVKRFSVALMFLSSSDKQSECLHLTHPWSSCLNSPSGECYI